MALLALASVVPPSHASESLAAFAAFSSDGDAVERARDVLDRLETLPQIETIPLWLFVMTLSEMLPLFPSQPAALTSGIVFGAKEGAAMVVAANMTAATLAFLAARGAGGAGVGVGAGSVVGPPANSAMLRAMRASLSSAGMLLTLAASNSTCWARSVQYTFFSMPICR